MTEVLNRHRRGITCAAWGRGGRLALGGRDQQVGSHCYPTLPYLSSSVWAWSFNPSGPAPARLDLRGRLSMRERDHLLQPVSRHDHAPHLVFVCGMWAPGVGERDPRVKPLDYVPAWREASAGYCVGWQDLIPLLEVAVCARRGDLQP